jgi:putative ABC transport system permease protein
VDAARDLRQVLANRPAAEQLHALLARPEIQRGLQDVESVVPDRERARLAALRAEAAQPQVTAEFVSMITDPRVRSRLLGLARRVGGSARGATPLLESVATLSVLPLKQEALDQAQEWGAVITTVFLLLGIFSIAAAILLIFLIFALLAADRSAELATVRAIGMRRHQVMGMFLSEGLLYNIAGAALGTLASLVSGYALVTALSSALDPFGIQLTAQTEPRSLVIAFGGGVLLTFATMLVAAWRVSDVDIVAATRGEQIDGQRWRVVMGVLLLFGAGMLWWRWRDATYPLSALHQLLLPSAVTLTLLGTLACVGALPWRGAGQQISDSFATVSGVAIGGVWLWTLIQLPSARGNVRSDVLAVALGGVVLSMAAGWTAVRVLGPLVKMVDQVVGNAAMGAVLRPAAGYLSGERWRTGLTVLMFGMVVLIMVAALTLLHVVSNAYAGREAPVAGYELRADWGGEPIADMEAVLAEASAVGRDSFRAVGGISFQDVQSVQLGAPRAQWQPTTLAVADDGFLSGIAASMERRAATYPDDRAVWAALQTQPGTAVATARSLEQIDPTVGDENSMQPVTVWIRSQQGGQPVKLSVIGVVDAGSELDDGIYTSRTTAAEFQVPVTAPRTYFFAVQPGVRPTDAADGLQLSFADQSISVTNLGDQARIIATVRLLLTRLVQGFMGLGLLAGIAALALLGGQAVIERRQQLGTLRVLGYTRRHIRTMLAIESAVIAALGIGLGVVLGLFLARSVVDLLSTTYFELRYAVPWSDIAFIIAVAWLGSTLAMLVAAWYAGRVSPADALRSGS